MSHPGENPATKGYVVVSIDHTFVLNEIDRMSREPGSFLNGLADAGDTGIIGCPMGGYGAVITAGGGVTQASTEYSWGAPASTLQVHLAGSNSHEALIDPRIKAAVAIAPWA